MGNSTSDFDRINVIFRVHCFNDYRNQTCLDLEISYLVQCDNWQESQRKRTFRRRDVTKEIECPHRPHVTYSPLSSADKIPSIKFIYLVTAVFAY